LYRPTGLDIYIYLRKSRSDIEEEKKSKTVNAVYDTLERHRETLLQTVKKENHNIIDIFEEVVSGESINERPEMQKLLSAIEDGKADAILVMDMDRLGRGDMFDQGTLDRAFRYSKTKIITTTEVYDPEAESWELVFGIKSIVAREELKAITRRLQRGRKKSASEGKSISKKPPYGYTRNKDLILEPDEETAWVIKKIFEMMRGGQGRQAIAGELDKLGVKPPDAKHEVWSPSTITALVKNEVYIGHIIWGKYSYEKRHGQYKRIKVPPEKWIVKKDAHEALVSEELWEAANQAHKGRWRPSTVETKSLSNPLAGILKCELCGHTLWYQPRKDRPNHMLRCASASCRGKQKGVILSLVEQRIIQGLEELVGHIEIQESMIEKRETNSTVPLKEKAKEAKEKELTEINQQKERLHDFLERGVYTIEIFLERQQNLVERIKQTRSEIEVLEQEIEKEKFNENNINQYLPTVKKVLDAYKETDDIEKKNRLLKSILEKVTYLRKKEWTKKDQFKIELYPKI
jgi:site-specific DNA recombinase